MKIQELIKQISLAEADRQAAQKRLREAKKKMIDAESDLIEANIKIDRFKESLREAKMVTPVYVESARDREIEEFCLKFPELCTGKKDG